MKEAIDRIYEYSLEEIMGERFGKYYNHIKIRELMIKLHLVKIG